LCATIFLMKEAYFTRASIASCAQEMLQDLYPDGQHTAKNLDPEGCALLVLDMQAYFLNPDSHAFVPSAPVILPGLRKLVDTFQDQGRPVFLTQHINTVQDAGSMQRWWRDLITADHPFSGLVPEFTGKGHTKITKTQYDAFYHTDLEHQLEGAGVRQVVISGVMTHLCCETTARSAFTRGWDVFFLVDGTATYNRAFHVSSLRNIGHGFGTLLTCQDVENVMRRGGG